MMPEIITSARPRLSLQVRLQWDPVRGKNVLLVPEGVLLLNETGEKILALCDGHHSVDSIAAELGLQYDCDSVDQEVLSFLTRLVEKRLVEFVDDS